MSTTTCEEFYSRKIYNELESVTYALLSNHQNVSNILFVCCRFFALNNEVICPRLKIAACSFFSGSDNYNEWKFLANVYLTIFLIKLHSFLFPLGNQR
jgi:hypothetical protein